jgi:polyhydroxyalkanoate synthesis repressor PhaR
MKTIKRYPNRKLYDTERSRYITLDEIGVFLRSGGEVQVVDSRTGEDITAVTLAQVLLGEEKKSRPAVPIQRLIGLLQTGGEFIKGKLGSPVTSLRDEAEKTMQRLMHGEPAEELRDFVVSTHKAYDEVQRRVDERLQVVLATVRHLSPLQKDVDRLKTTVEELRRRVEALEGRSGRGRARVDGQGQE